MKAYFSNNEGKVTTLDDFRAAWEEETGEALGWFFEQWYERPGWPVLDIRWVVESRETSTYALQLNVDQIGRGVFRIDRYPVVVEFRDGSTREFAVDLRAVRSQKQTLALDQEVEAVRFDPDSWIVAEVRK